MIADGELILPGHPDIDIGHLAALRTVLGHVPYHVFKLYFVVTFINFVLLSISIYKRDRKYFKKSLAILSKFPDAIFHALPTRLGLFRLKDFLGNGMPGDHVSQNT